MNRERTSSDSSAYDCSGIKVPKKRKPPETSLIPYAGHDPFCQEHNYPKDTQSQEILHDTMKMMDRCNPVHSVKQPDRKLNRFLDTPEGVEALKRLRERELYLAEAHHPHLPEAYLLRVPELSALEDMS